MRIYGIFQTTCPSGWTLESGWAGKFLMGAASYNGTETGAAQHWHSVTPTGAIGGTAQVVSTSGDYLSGGAQIHRQEDNHTVTHQATYSGYTDNLPPYLDVVYCYQEV